MDNKTNEKYALISWKKRIENNKEIQTLNSWVNCKVLISFDGELLFNYINQLIENNKENIIHIIK